MGEPKKKNFCRRNKKNWRKYISTKDVDEFLDQKRFEERIGGPIKNKKDEQLFVIDTSTNLEASITENQKMTKKQRAFLPPKCLENLLPLTAVPDPITKRNRVKSKEERKSVIRKNIEAYKRNMGIVKKKILDARKQRVATLRKKKLEPTSVQFKNDLWDDNSTKVADDKKKEHFEWLTRDGIRHTLTNTNSFQVHPPKGIFVKKSLVPPIETPHPGISYNPTYQEHQHLLNIVIDKELELLKEEAHIKRVTTDVFQKQTKQEKEESWYNEMSQGLFNKEDGNKTEDEEGDGEYKALNPPSNYLKKKTRKQLRKKKEERQNALLRKDAKVEKRKTADIYKLKFINAELNKSEEATLKKIEKRKKLAVLNLTRTKRLGAKSFTPPDIEFSRKTDLTGNLRAIKKQGNLLVDRFYSLQRRNILAPSTKQIGLKKAKVKRFVKPSHRIPE